MIVLSWSTQRGEAVNAVEDLEPELGADLTRDPRLRPPRHHATEELGQRRDQPGDRESEHRIAMTERVKNSTGSPVHRARAPGERTREHPARRRQERVAGSVHHRADDDGETQRRMRQNRSRCSRDQPRVQDARTKIETSRRCAYIWFQSERKLQSFSGARDCAELGTMTVSPALRALQPTVTALAGFRRFRRSPASI